MFHLLVLATQLLSAYALTKQDVTVVDPKIRAIIATNPPLLGTIVRLSFHDCAGKDGCDGCLGEQLTENAGLAGAMNALEVVYRTLSPQPSRADFWALSGIVASNIAIEKTGRTAPFELTTANFRWGRKDCPTSPHSNTDTAADFPSAFLGNTGILNYFATNFKFTTQQTVAIMGAHNLGRAHLTASGFTGVWKGATPDALDNGYYANLQNNQRAWAQVAPTPNHLQWVRPPPPGTPAPRPGQVPPNVVMMLDADVALLKNIAPSSTDGRVACQFANCPAATTGSQTYVGNYANPRNVATFQKDFGKAFAAMLEVCGRPSLGAVTPCPTAPVQ